MPKKASAPESEESASPAQLKEWFNEASYGEIAHQVRSLDARFDRKRFLEMTLEGLEGRSLMERLRKASEAMEASLPGSFRAKAGVARRMGPLVGHPFVAVFLCDFVALHGLEDYDFSMETLRSLTRHGSAEFAVRPFLIRDLERGLGWMLKWTGDADEHVRRLASEGARPRLPWGQKLQALVENPGPVEPILMALRGDGSEYVRKSVANHLNDITKDHPEWVLGRLSRWDLTHEGMRWIAKHALRTLIKRGDVKALGLFGFGAEVAVRGSIRVPAARLKLGEVLVMEVGLESTLGVGGRAQDLAVDYVIHYVKADGESRPKVFKGWEVRLGGGECLRLTKRQVLKDFTTRKHHAGRHVVELQVNGKKVARTEFQLVVGGEERGGD